MSILGINKSIKKVLTTYIFVTVFAIVFNRIYALFGHGVSSFYMSFMFLYPLIGGAIYYFILGLILGKFNYDKLRLSFNIYNSGIAILTVGSLLHGILEIAGTSSQYIGYYTLIGWITIIIGVTCTMLGIILSK